MLNVNCRARTTRESPEMQSSRGIIIAEGSHEVSASQSRALDVPGMTGSRSEKKTRIEWKERKQGRAELVAVVVVHERETSPFQGNMDCYSIHMYRVVYAEEEKEKGIAWMSRPVTHESARKRET